MIEISLALAIVGYAFVALLGLLTPGLGNYSAAMNTQTSAEIYQRIAADLQDSDFDTLVPVSGSDQFYVLPQRYFDVQGGEVRSSSGTLGPSDVQKVIYTARVRGSMPGVADPSKHTATYFTSLPALSGKRFNPRDVTFITVQVALSQGREIDSLLDSSTKLISPAKAAKAGVSFRTYSLMVARNGYKK